MAQFSRGGRGRPSRGRTRGGARQSTSNRGRGRGGGRGRSRGRFTGSRLKEEEDVDETGGSPLSEDLSDHEPEESVHEESSSSEDDNDVSNTYSTLLKTLKSRQKDATPARKKRKLNERPNGTDEPDHATESGDADGDTEGSVQEEDTTTVFEEVVDDAVEAEDVDDSDDEDQLLHDPFEKHYVSVSEADLKNVTGNGTSQKRSPSAITTVNDVRKTIFPGSLRSPSSSRSLKQPKLHLKQRLKAGGEALTQSLSGDEQDTIGAVFDYCDVLSGCRTINNSTTYRDICALHALNHVFKTRDRVLKNNTKLRQQDASEELDYRDQGFTRPKVLVMVPTKQACVKFVESIVKFSEPEQQENRSRFMETYSRQDEDEWENKPDDFRELFGGNHDEDFRLGLKFTRKTIKFFSGFYNSDIIVGSPLGLMRTITTGGGGKDKKKVHDADFLSSIEVVIVDHASALQMQNWQHVEYVFSQLNHLPKDSHGCDFSRVRNWYLDGHAKFLRQTIIFSSYLTPEINALANSQLHNISDRIKYMPTYSGTMLEVSSSLPVQVTQTFLRFDSASPLTDHDARFKYFATTLLPSLLRDTKHHQKGVLLYVPTYLDFVRLRNYLSTSADTSSLSFGSISEYSPPKDVARARSHFLSGRHTVLLYSERAHHHFRYRIKGVKKVLFYGVPENPKFWNEVVGFLGIEDGKGNEKQERQGGGKGMVRAMFSKWDVIKLERIVGTERVGRLVNEKGGDTFDFI